MSTKNKLRARVKQNQIADPFLHEIVQQTKRTFASVFIFSFFLNLLALTVPIYLLQIYSKVIPNKSFDTLLFLTMIALAAVVTFGILDSIRRTVLDKLAIRFDSRLSEHVLSSSIQHSLIEPNKSVNAMRDLTGLRNFIASSAVLPLLDIPWTPLFILILFILHPALGVIGLFGVAILVALALYNEYRTRDGVKAASRNSRELIDNARSVVRNSDVVQAMGMQQQFLSKWRENNTKYHADSYSNTRTSRRLQSLSKQARLVLQIGIVCTAAWLILHDVLSPGVTIASVLLFRRAISPLEQSIRSWKTVLKARTSYENLKEYLKYSTTLKDFHDMPAPEGSLVAEKTSYRRPGETKPVFHRATLTVDPGKIVVLTGPSGHGKTTLLKALVGVVPLNSGKITLGNYELDNWSPEQLGPSFGYMPQNVGLFPGTVRDNIGRMTDQPIEDIIKAAKTAYAHTMIQSLPDGYDTVINEGATNLSGGQIQKIGLARALFGLPGYVFLDEPDANLDATGRSELRRTLRFLKLTKTAVILTTHRQSFENLCDAKYVLADGKLSIEERSVKSSKSNLKKFPTKSSKQTTSEKKQSKEPRRRAG